jgi:MFS transporter, ACS family, glucarate transporter
LVIAIVWYHFARDTPRQHASVTQQERAHIEAGVPVRIEGAMPPVPWAKIFSSKNVWGTALAYAGFGYAATIFSTWFFIYLKDGRGFDLKSSAILGTYAALHRNHRLLPFGRRHQRRTGETL